MFYLCSDVNRGAATVEHNITGSLLQLGNIVLMVASSLAVPIHNLLGGDTVKHSLVCVLMLLSNSAVPRIDLILRDTESIVFGGLEPLEQFNELCSFLEVLRGQFQCKDDVVIYTGYYFEEVPEWIQQLATYGNVIVKFGRYIPNQKHIFDEVLGVELASDNQYAERFDS